MIWKKSMEMAGKDNATKHYWEVADEIFDMGSHFRHVKHHNYFCPMSLYKESFPQSVDFT